MVLGDHLSAELLAAYRARRLPPAQLLAVDDHVLTCFACRAVLRAATPGRAALHSLAASIEAPRTVKAHVCARGLRAYIENRLDAAGCASAERHLESCAVCRTRAKRFLLSLRR